MSGIAGTWTIAAAALGTPAGIGLLLWGAAALAWLAVLATYASTGVRSGASLLAELRHPLLGPFAALVPVVAILVGGELARYWLFGGTVLVTAGLIVVALLSAWSLAEWLTGSIDARLFHPGYFLSVVAGGLIGAIGLASVGAHDFAVVAFWIGVFFWLVLSAVIIARLAALSEFPAGLLPTLAIFSVPPSVAGIAWFGINGERLDVVHDVLLGLMLFLLLSQLFLIPRYARVPFGIGYWSFTFTVAAPATYGIHWLLLARPFGWQGWAWLILAVATLWISWIAARSVGQVFSRVALARTVAK